MRTSSSETVTVTPDAVLHGVGAPGSPSLLDAWREASPTDEVERLEAAVRAAGPTEPQWPALYLAGRKP